MKLRRITFRDTKFYALEGFETAANRRQTPRNPYAEKSSGGAWKGAGDGGGNDSGAGFLCPGPGEAWAFAQYVIYSHYTRIKYGGSGHVHQRAQTGQRPRTRLR